MKKIALITITALSVGLFQACSGDGSSTADSTAIAKKDSAATIMANPDTAFAKKAAAGGLAEVALGNLALTKTSSTKIKDFAKMMVTDHSKANDALTAIAKTKNIALPVTVDAGHAAKMDSLRKLSDADFNKAYVALMVEGHEKTLTLMQDEAKNGKDADFKAFAAKTAPVVQMHLDAINKIHSSMK